MEIIRAAEKEKKRMEDVMKSLEQKKTSKEAKEFYAMAVNYCKDGIYFFDKKDFLRAFEAFIISWGYVDAGLKMKFFAVPSEQKKWFTA